ncbi:phage tail protein [Anaerolactibacter massiliensis]|uniref:phage tail-collar fiber domain-containing protein n=1 Tax=Anaerolactibacter massiliensis TaxID=2044573 RepID=UPI000CFA5952|nr:phage tail protein [Anaerolactibacter massiliensis]
MAQFNSVVMTNRGIALITKALAGQCTIEFTKVQAGSGTWSTSALQGATALRQNKQEFGVSRVRKVNDSTISLLGVLSNLQLTHGYYVNEFGIFACEAGKQSSTECLYAIVTAVDGQADYMPPYNSVSPQLIEIETYVAVANAEQVSVKLDTGAIASAADLNQLINDVGAKSDLKTRTKSTIVGAVNEAHDTEASHYAAVTKSVSDLSARHTSELNAAKEAHQADVDRIDAQINGFKFFVNSRRRLCITQNIDALDE